MHVRLVIGLAAALAASNAIADPIKLDVDARDVSRQVFHVTETIPAASGALTLAFPRWLPGYHSPDGKVVNLVDLHIKAAGDKGADIEWQRDAVEMDQFHLAVPAGATGVEVAFNFLVKDDDVSRELAVLEWNNVVLYPIPSKMTELEVAPTVELPKDWEWATALYSTDSGAKPRAAFKTVSLMTLIDSPLFAGKYHKSIDVGPVNGTPHHIEMFADSEKALEMDDAMLAAHKKLPQEAFALFGAQHYSRYQWLVALAGDMDDGIEHHESSDNRIGEDALSNDDTKPAFTNLLSHEFVHSWNGKHRRPAGMVVDDFQQPEKTDLLWVYEGLTEYWGLVLSARSGAWSDSDFRDEIARYADQMIQAKGRDWRTLHDVAATASLLYGAPKGNHAERRSSGDFYVEGTLLWLDADVKIRNLTDGKKSLDDFAKRFYGGAGGKATLETYTFDDVVAALNDVAPFDWATFLHDRVDKIALTPPLGGITDGGYTLDYTADATDFAEKRMRGDDSLSLAASIGLDVNPDDGTINDVIPGSPADKAGVPVGGKILTVNEMKYTGDRLTDAVAKTKAYPLTLLVEHREQVMSFKLDYTGGQRYPTLKRDEAKPDRIAEITKPLTK